MKKYIIGFIVGAIVSVAGTAYADGIKNVIGLKVEGSFPVKVNGVKASNDAVIIDGSSYLPVRAMGEALNMDVTFDADLGIELKEKEEEKGVTTVTDTPITSTTEPSKEWKIDDLKSKLRIAKTSLSYVEQDLKEFPTAENQKTIDRLKSQITDYESQLAALEAQK